MRVNDWDCQSELESARNGCQPPHVFGHFFDQRRLLQSCKGVSRLGVYAEDPYPMTGLTPSQILRPVDGVCHHSREVGHPSPEPLGEGETPCILQHGVICGSWLPRAEAFAYYPFPDGNLDVYVGLVVHPFLPYDPKEPLTFQPPPRPKGHHEVHPDRHACRSKFGTERLRELREEIAAYLCQLAGRLGDGCPLDGQVADEGENRACDEPVETRVLVGSYGGERSSQEGNGRETGLEDL